jgi:c-di-GMP-binding flagellar brake protein YcgR
MLVILFVTVAIAFVIVLIALSKGGKRYSWIEFYFRGFENAISFSESRLVRDASKLAGLRDPTNAYWDVADLDRAIKAVGSFFRSQQREHDRDAVALTEKLFKLRKKLEFEQPKYKYGIRGSKQISANQRLKLLAHGVGAYSATVIDNNARYLVISYPSGGHVPRNFAWKGVKMSVYFWRNEDAGYVFDTFVIDDLRVRNIPVLHLAHSESLFRTQKRKSIRVRSRISAWLYLPKRLEGAFEKPERSPGLRCVVQDLSEDGFSALIGGKAKEGMIVKAQFYIGERQVVMSGTVKAVDYSADKNQSMLHVEAVEPSPRMKNAIRMHVYNLKGEGNEAANPFA